MPRIQVLQPQVRPAARPPGYSRVSGSPEDFGAGIGQAAQGLSGELQQLSNKFTEEATATRLMDLRRETNVIAYDLTSNPESGALQRRGVDAVGVTEETITEFRERTESLAEKLPPGIRNLYSQWRDQEMDSMRSALSQHENAEATAYGKVTYEGGQAETARMASTMWENPVMLGAKTLQMEQDTAARAVILGLKGPALEAFKTEARSNFHGLVTEAMLDGGNAVSAKEYLARFADKMNPQMVDALNRRIKPISDSQQVQLAADEYFKPGDLAGSIAAYEAGHRTDPLRADVTKELEHRFQVWQEVRREDEKQEWDSFYNVWNANGRNFRNPKVISLYSQLPADDQERIRNWEESDALHRRQLAAASAEERAALTAERNAVSSSVYYAHVLESIEDPHGFVGKNFAKEDGPLLTPTDLKNLGERQASLAASLDSKENTPAGLLSAEQRLAETAFRVGILERKKKPEDQKRDPVAMSRLNTLARRYETWVSERKGDPTPEESQEKMDQLATEVLLDTAPDHGWFMRLFASPTRSVFPADLNEDAVERLIVPDVERQKIYDWAARQHVTLSEADIRRQYARKLGIVK